MAFSNIQKEMQTFFNDISKGVRDDMDKNYIHILELDFKEAARGFDKAARKIAGTRDYLTKGDPKTSWEDEIRKICKEWSAGDRSQGIDPGQVFRTVKMVRPANYIKKIGIPNITIQNYTTRSCEIVVLVASNHQGGQRLNTFLTNFRQLVWKKWNDEQEQGGFISERLKYGRDVGANTNFGHSQQSTVGLKSLQNLDEARQQDPDNPFEKARDFIGRAGFTKEMSMEDYVSNQLLGQGASIQFEKRMVNGRMEQVIVGRIDPDNVAGSEVTDKKHFNTHIKSYYKRHFIDRFDQKNSKDQKKIAKSMGYKTVSDFKTSESYNDHTKKEVGSRLVKNLTSTGKLKKQKGPKKPGKVNVKHKVKPKRPRKVVVKKKAARVNTNPRPHKSAGVNIGNPIALKELIQAALPDEILKNMNFPALVNRTGRFRRSATITNVLVGPRGGTEVEYTYMKDPYQTFEPGGKRGGTYRDPRRIIGGSIREIASKLTGNKFIRTRRV